MNTKMKMIVAVSCCIFFVLSSSWAEAEISGTVIDGNTGIQEREINKFIKNFSKAYKKGNADEYMAFYTPDSLENGVNTFDKIMANYLHAVAQNVVSTYEIEISDINYLGHSYVVVDALYHKTLTEKSRGESFMMNGNLRMKIKREDNDLRIAAIEYDRYIRNDYIIGLEDVIEVSVWKSPDLSTTIMVRPDGMISLPLLGDIRASSRSTGELKEEIQKRLTEYKQDPIVSIIVKEANSQTVYVTGEVSRPGKYPLRSDITIVQAITLAGGFTQWADKDKIIVIRKSPMVPEGNRFTLKYSDIVSGKNMKANILLKAGDTVIIP